MLWSKRFYYERSNKMDTPMARRIAGLQRHGGVGALRDGAGNVHRSASKIRDIFTTFYEKIYNHSPHATLDNPTHVANVQRFLSELALPTLTEAQTATLGAPIDSEEVRTAIGLMQPNKAPGPDGLPGLYYKSFLPILLPHLTTMCNSARSGTPFARDSLTASIVTILKPGKDPLGPGNYRPISLLNFDIKVLAKVLALRLNEIIPTLIHADQVGFIPGRQAYDNTRRACDLVWLAQRLKVPAVFLSLDAEKAFDRVGWAYLFQVLTHLGFPQEFTSAIGVMYDTPVAQVVVPGTPPRPFRLTNGTRQGCPLSPLLFALSLEPLLSAVRADPLIAGVAYRGEEYKVSAYADDVLLSLTCPVPSVARLLEVLDRFSGVAGYKVNMTKSTALLVGASDGDAGIMEHRHGFCTTTESISYLGVRIPGSHSEIFTLNYAPLIQCIKSDLDRWAKLHISWLGRVHCIKMNVLPRLLYLFQALPISVTQSDLTSLQTAIDAFVWDNKRHRVARQTLFRPRAAGGMGLPSLLSYYRAARLAQIVAWHSPMGARRWVDLESSMMSPDLPQFWLWTSPPYRPTLRTECPAIVAAVKLWDSVAVKCDLTSYPSPLTPILRNEEFPPGLCPQPFGLLEDAGLQRLVDFYPKGALLHYPDLQSTHSLPPSTFFRFLQMRDFITKPHLRAAALTKPSWFERLCLQEHYPKGLISTIYSSITSTLEWKELTYINAWHKDLGEELEGDEWLDIWEAARRSSICTTHQEQSLKMIFRWYTTPEKLVKMKVTTTDVCWRLCGDKGTFLHMWWSCPRLKPLWSKLHSLAQTVLERDIPFVPKVFLLASPLEDLSLRQNKLLAKMSLAGRRAIAAEWRAMEPPHFGRVLANIRDVALMDELSARVHHTMDAFSRLWEPWVNHDV
uniref:Reverse transcriptase domain-containing protein n=1 Tax=Leptobrachium leishanense TaxID=445787 RepID=A0A8C5N3B2_9ANUR